MLQLEAREANAPGFLGKIGWDVWGEGIHSPPGTKDFWYKSIYSTYIIYIVNIYILYSMYITSRSKSKLNDHFTSLLHLNLFGTLPKFIVTLLWTCLKVNSSLSRFSRPPWCSLHNLQSFAISLPVLCGASLPVRCFNRQRWLVTICHLEFGTAIFDGNWSVSWRGRASALGLNQKWNHVPHRYDRNRIQNHRQNPLTCKLLYLPIFLPSWKPFLRNHLKCLFPANLAWSLLASLDLASEWTTTGRYRQHDAAKLVKRHCTCHFALASCQQFSEEFSLLLFGGPAAVVAKLDPVATWQGSSSNNYKRKTNLSPTR